MLPCTLEDESVDMIKPIIVEHCFGSPHLGGPATSLERIQAFRDTPHPELRQYEAAGGISISLLRRFVFELRRLRPDLLHVRGLGNEGFHGVLAGRLAGVPRILVTVHGTQRDLVGEETVRRQIVVNVLERVTLQLADAIVTVSEAAAQRDFLKPYRHKLLSPIVNGVPLVSRDPDIRASMRSRLGISDNRVAAVIVSRMSMQKGYGDLAAAMHHLKNTNDINGIDLIVVGGGEEAPEIEALFAGLDSRCIHFVGLQENVSPFLMAADLFIFPSWHENLSIALLEAMAHGLPVIATAVGGNVEVVEKGGGILVPPHDPPALAKALAYLARDECARFNAGLAAEQNVAAHYSISRMNQAWADCYAKLLDQHST
jgi:glycosyltransferase involved in cell wall biosynthesis